MRTGLGLRRFQFKSRDGGPQGQLALVVMRGAGRGGSGTGYSPTCLLVVRSAGRGGAGRGGSGTG